MIHVTYLRGRYEARGNTWNEESGNGYKPASVNLIQRTARMANAVKAFIERQGVKLPVEIEPVLIAGKPGLAHRIGRPAIKVMMIDGIKSFASGLATGQTCAEAWKLCTSLQSASSTRARPRRQTAARAAA